MSLERFWDEVAWQCRNLEEGDTPVPDPEHRCFTVRYRSGGLPAERCAEVTATGTDTNTTAAGTTTAAVARPVGVPDATPCGTGSRRAGEA